MHSHGHGHGHAHGRADNRRRIAIALGITLTLLVAEAIGAAVTGSLALLADAGHLATDALGLVVALAAAVLAVRPPSATRTFGFGRLEVLAAAANALLLLVVGGTVLYQAVHRFAEPVEVPSGPLLVLGVVGLLGNLAALAVLAGGDRESLNLRGALLEVMGDALGSVAVIASALVIRFTGWQPADAVASLVIAALILPRSLMLLRDAAHVLLEGTPPGVDCAEVRAALLGVRGVTEVHDLHLWSITSGEHAVSAHLVVDGVDCLGCGESSVLDQAAAVLRERFGLGHSTLQIEHATHDTHEGVTHT
ncbi:MAG TPA: cation diffusion facilitator family transporter [Pseudonocardiaceae bacterium]